MGGGAVLSRAGGQLFVLREDGAVGPAYVQDLAGRVIYSPGPLPVEGVFSEGSLLVRFREESKTPTSTMPSREALAVTLFRALDRLEPGVRARYQGVYPEGRFPVVDALWFDHRSAPVDEAEIRQVIEALDDAGLDEEMVAAAVERLEEVGVCRIPALERFHGRYHQPAQGPLRPGTAVRERLPGWVLNGKVLRKAKVEAR